MGRSVPEALSVKRAPPTSDDHQALEQLEQLVNQASDTVRIIMLHGEVNETSIAQVIAQLLHLASINHKPINLVISTYGGAVDEMFSLYDTIKFLPCAVHTIALGKVMSAGVLLLATGEKGRRLVGRSARIMIHPMSCGVYGNIFEIDNQNREVKRLQDLMVECLVRETRMSKDQINKIMKKGHDYFLTPDQAIKLGIVDKVVGE